MKASRTRIASVFVMVAALALSFAVAATAFAAPGDSEANATWLNDPARTYMASSLTTSLASAVPTSTGKYYFRVQLGAGNTFRANFTPAPGVINLKALMLPYAYNAGYRIVESVTDSSGVARLSFMASKSGMYNIYVGSSTLGTFTIEPKKVSAVKFSLGAMSASSSQKARKTFNVATTMYPRYNGSRTPIKFYVQRRVSGQWKASSSKTATFVSETSTSTKYKAAFNLPAGKYRIRARFADAAHSTPKYNSYKTIYVR